MENSLTAPPQKVELPDQSVLPKFKQMVEGFYSSTRQTADWAERNRRYYDGDMITEEERKELRKRRQPEVKENLIKRAVNGLVGVAKDQSVDPRAYPRNGGSEEDIGAADVASKALRFVADKARFNANTRARAMRSMLVEGVVGCEAEWRDSEIVPTIIKPDQIVYDPHAREENFSDARFLGHSRWGWIEDVEQLYPEAKGQITGETSVSGSDQRGDDKPSFVWFEKSALGERVAVVTLYVKMQGQWMRAVFTESVLLEYGPSPYLDDKKQPACGMIAQCVYRDGDNNIYAYTNDLIDLQDEVIKRRSKLLHLLNTAQLQEVAEGAFIGDIEQARREAARPDGVIPSGLQRVPTTDMSAGQANLLQQTKADFERASPNPAILGRQGADASGRAMQIRQQAGLTELEAEFSALEEFTIRCYEMFWARIRQFWTGPRFVRVTDDLKAAQLIQVNKPVYEEQFVPNEFGQMVPQTVQVGVENGISELDLDIIVDVSPNTVTLAQEQFSLLVELAKSGVPIPPDALIRASQLPDKAAILEQMKGPQEPSPMDQAAGEKAKADIRKTNADAAKSEASAQEIAQRVGIEASMMGVQSPPPGVTGEMSMPDTTGNSAMMVN